MSTETAPLPVGASRTRSNLYSQIACGMNADTLAIQILGLTTGKGGGKPVVASEQKAPFKDGDWTPTSIALTGTTAPVTLDELTVCAGSSATEAVGLGSDGRLYAVGSVAEAASWVGGRGAIATPTTFAPNTLSSWPINTVTVFAVSPTGAPYVAAYQDASQAWQSGYPLPKPDATALRSFAARPDLSDAGTTHAIGLTTTGEAYEIATAQGPGIGVANWSAGKGRLGSASGLPVFNQLLLISGDNNQVFHVIGLGSDGSVWDVDTYSISASTWSGTSTTIAASGSITEGTIDFYLSTTAAGETAINLLAWAGSSLTCFATFVTGWTASTTTVPTAGVSSKWQVIDNSAAAMDGDYGDVFIIGLSGVGLVYELSYFHAGTWTAGAPTPINK